MADAFIAAGAEYGYRNTDPNGEQLLGVGRAQATMRNGRRCSAAKAFLRPIIGRSNLEIAMNARVLRILIDAETHRAYGVEFVKNRKRYRVLARKEVILSAGTIASPQLLMLSGIGPREDLMRLGVPVVQDLRVGYNLQDHVAFNGLEFLVNRSVTISEANVQTPQHIFDYLYNGRGPYTIPGGAEALAFVKTWNSSYREYGFSVDCGPDSNILRYSPSDFRQHPIIRTLRSLSVRAVWVPIDRERYATCSV